MADYVDNVRYNLLMLEFKEAQHGRLCVPRASPRHGFEEEQSESSHIHEDQVGQNCGSGYIIYYIKFYIIIVS